MGQGHMMGGASMNDCIMGPNVGGVKEVMSVLWVRMQLGLGLRRRSLGRWSQYVGK